MSMEELFALHADPLDNVATVFSGNVTAGCTVAVHSRDGSSKKIRVTGDIPYGHKIAVKKIRRGEKIIKYGECIGEASRDIARGEYVHVHNLAALRGRGDLQAGS